MFFHALWRTPESSSVKSFCLRTRYANADLVLRCEGGQGELGLLSHVQVQPGSMKPESYTACGLLLALLPELPKIDGEGTTLKFTPIIPCVWREAVLAVFSRAGFAPVRLSSAALELEINLAPEGAIERAAVLLFALDSFSRGLAGPELFDTARSVSLRLPNGAELLELLDAGRGGSRLRKLLGQGSAEYGEKQRDKAIVSALGRIRARKIVCFHCRSGRLLRSLAETLSPEKLINVEPSLVRVSRGATGYELLHGSVLEVPPEIDSDAAALLVGALPPSRDLRFARAAEALLKKHGFAWVLCLAARHDIEEWTKLGESFGYRVSEPWRIGSDYAVMFRKTSHDRACVMSSPAEIRIEHRFGTAVQLDPQQWIQTLEATSCKTVDPRWLIYLPPRPRSLPSDRLDGDLEHPQLIFDYYRNEGIKNLVVEAKPVSSRAVVVVCLNEVVARTRFGIGELGCIYTRRGKAFFKDPIPMLKAVREALTRDEFWKRFNTNWVCFEGEILHSLADRSGELLRLGEAVYREAGLVLERLAPKGLATMLSGKESFKQFRAAYEQRCSPSGVIPTFAPVRLIATEGTSYFAKSNLWQMQNLAAIIRSSAMLLAEVPYRSVALNDPAAIKSCIEWWLQLCALGAEGVVIKPFDSVPKGRRGTAQPGFICRGREHLRFVYGPDYDLPENRLAIHDGLARGNRREKNRATLKQLYLSIEAVERFLRKEPIERVEECVRGLLALEHS